MKKDYFINIILPAIGIVFIILGIPLIIASISTWIDTSINEMTYIEYMTQIISNISKSLTYFFSRLI